MRKILRGLLLASLILSSCGSEKSEETSESAEVTSEDISMEIPEEEILEVSFAEISLTEEYPDAILELYTPLGNQVFRPGKVPFEFNIKNYPFLVEGSEEIKLLKILNGNNPVEHNAPIFQEELTEGSYRCVAYLVDENGFALKNFGNYVDRDFQVGESRPFPYSAEPYLALNLPKNQQKFKFGDPIPLDFLVLGGDMKLDGLRVTVKVNDKEHIIREMIPSVISGLSKGEHTIQLTLNRIGGKDLEGPFSQVNKTIFVE